MGRRSFGKGIDVTSPALRSYQLKGVSFLMRHRRALLADAMGLGKSCTAISAAKKIDGKVLIVCPAHVRGVWAAPMGELNKWWPDVRVQVLQGTSPSAPDPFVQVVVIHYDILYAWADELLRWAPQVVIFDECHALMSTRSRRSIAARKVSSHAPYRWGLSGTPLTNRPRDLWNVVDTLDPGRLGGFFPFGIRYCGGHQKRVSRTRIAWDFSGSSNESELKQSLSSFILRRIATDVALEIPAKTRQIFSVEVPTKPQAIRPVRAWPVGAIDLRWELNLIADEKIDVATDLILNHAKEGHKVIPYTWRRVVANVIAARAQSEGLSAGAIHGGLSYTHREKTLSEAKKAAGGYVLAATIDSASTGIDLSYADVAVFVELTYEPHELLQAEARLHRWGQQKPVLIQYVIASGTLDEAIAEAVISKLDVYDQVVGPTGETLQTDLANVGGGDLTGLYDRIAKHAAEEL